VTDDTARLRELALKATPGPWKLLWPEYDPEHKHPEFTNIWQWQEESGRCICDFPKLVPEARSEQAATAEFIAACDPQTIVALLDRLAAAESERNGAKAFVKIETNFRRYWQARAEAAESRERAARANALEEAAKVCDAEASVITSRTHKWTAMRCAKAIRALAVLDHEPQTHKGQA